MDPKDILKFCIGRGILLDGDVLNLFRDTEDVESVKLIIEKIKGATSQKIITKNLFQNKTKVNEFFLELPKENQKKLEKLKIKLGLNIEISKEVLTNVEVRPKEIQKFNIEEEFSSLKINKFNFPAGRKIEVGDFVKYFRARFSAMKKILEQHAELINLVSINKISGSRQGISLIGIVTSKKITKNKNLIFEVEDLTGKIKILVNQNKPDLYKKAEDIALDAILGFKGTGNREIFFVNDVVFPDTMLFERKNAPIEEYALFTGDLHFGSKKFLKKSFLKFIDYLNGKLPNTPEVDKIKYLFFNGDIVTGIGNYPNQERDLEIKDLEEQFSLVAELLKKIRKDISIIISPGNHDGVRLMEPQPILDEKYAWPLYTLKNVFLTPNPFLANIGVKKDFNGFKVLGYHGFSFPYYANTVSSLIEKKAMNFPEKIMEYLLKNRHLAPTHGSAQYFPSEIDAHYINEAPDIFFAGHTHKSAVSYYNNILMISSSCWEALTPYQEKFGNEPDHCKVPMFNLKTRAIKILDFEEDENN